DPAIGLASSDNDQGCLVGQDTLAIRPRAVPCYVEHQVVTLPTAGEVLVRVVDDVVRAERADGVHIPRAAHADHLRSARLGDLDGKGAHAPARAVDQDLVPG